MIRLPFKMQRVGNLDLLVSDVKAVGNGLGARMIITTRRGGVSFGRGDLNISFGTGDEFEAVIQNRNHLLRAIGISSSQVGGVRQRHSADVLDVTEQNWEQVVKRELDGDGMITNLPHRCLSVTIGDCIALMLFDPIRQTLALLHIGWVGTAKRIVEAAIRKMEMDYGCRPSDMRAVFSPCVHLTSYQVDEPVFDLFRSHWQGWERFVTERSEGKGYLDLTAANRSLLEERGVPPSQVLDFGLCTSALSALFFSHRRESSPSGRVMVLACLT